MSSDHGRLFFDIVNESLDGALEMGLSEAQYDQIGRPHWMFDVEHRRDLRRGLVVNIYFIKSHLMFDQHTIGVIAKKLGIF